MPSLRKQGAERHKARMDVGTSIVAIPVMMDGIRRSPRSVEHGLNQHLGIALDSIHEQ